MQIFVVLILEFFIKSFTELTDVVWIRYRFGLGHIDELVLSLLEFFPLVFNGNFLGLPWFLGLNWPLVRIAIILATPFMELFLNGFNNLRPQRF